jgi:lipoprotein-releasing system permease protein
MRSTLFIARRIYFSKDGEKQVSPPAIRIATASLALGLAVMILAVAIAIGFQEEVISKVIGFGADVQIAHFDSNASYETHPIAVSDSLIEELRGTPHIRHAQVFATKPAIIKTDTDFQGVVMKGVDEDFDWTFFRANLKEGQTLRLNPDSTSNQILLSALLADRLNLKTGDSFLCYFIQEPPRVRKFTIAGIYQTHFADYDKLFIVGDIRQIRRLSDWDDDMASGIELFLDDHARLEDMFETLYLNLSARTDRMGNHYYPRTIDQMNPLIFAWLGVLDTNVGIILMLMALVAGFSMISGLLIIILERAQFIGLLKAMGETNFGIQKIFLYLSGFLIGKGLIWGNAIALAIYVLQKLTGVLKLDPEVYYVDQVPMELSIWLFVVLNLWTMSITLLMLILPSFLVSRISPAKTIRFE